MRDSEMCMCVCDNMHRCEKFNEQNMNDENKLVLFSMKIIKKNHECMRGDWMSDDETQIYTKPYTDKQ